jgi:hypothetical protein
MWLAAPSPSAAASYTLHFTGTVSDAYDSFAAAGVTAGDAISGSLTFDPINTSSFTTAYDPFATNNAFLQSAASFTFHVTHPGTLNFTRADAGTGEIDSEFFAPGPDFDELGLGGTGTESVLGLEYDATNSNPPLASLDGLPTTSSGLMALLGGTPFRSTGVYELTGFGSVAFDIALTATTPIPGALPLFLSALGGLGMFSRHRRRAAGDRFAPLAR